MPKLFGDNHSLVHYPFSSNSLLAWPRMSSYDIVDKLIDDRMSELGRTFPSRICPLDIKETSENFEVSCDLPGAKKEDVKIEIHDHIMTISTETKTEVNEESEKYWRRERFEGKMSKSIQLPENADKDNISARFEDGVLRVVIKKKAEAELTQRTKHITIE
jgi:HSP20 family protein